MAQPGKIIVIQLILNDFYETKALRDTPDERGEAQAGG